MHNKRMQRRPRSKFRMLQSVRLAAPLMRAVGRLTVSVIQHGYLYTVRRNGQRSFYRARTVSGCPAERAETSSPSALSCLEPTPLVFSSLPRTSELYNDSDRCRRRFVAGGIHGYDSDRVATVITVNDASSPTDSAIDQHAI